MDEKTNLTPGHRQYLKWKVTIMAEATTQDDVDNLTMFIEDAAIALLSTDLKGKQGGIMVSGPEKLGDLSDPVKPLDDCDSRCGPLKDTDGSVGLWHDQDCPHYHDV